MAQFLPGLRVDSTFQARLGQVAFQFIIRGYIILQWRAFSSHGLLPHSQLQTSRVWAASIGRCSKRLLSERKTVIQALYISPLDMF